MTKILNYSLLSLFLWDLYLKVNCKSINLKQSNIPKFSDNSRKRNHYPMCSLAFEAAYAGGYFGTFSMHLLMVASPSES